MKFELIRNYKLNRNILTFGESNELGDRVFLPIGCGFKKNNHKLYIHHSETGRKLVACKKEQTPRLSNIVILYPSFSSKKNIKIKGFGKISLDFFVVTNQLIWGDAQEIIRKSHYLKPVSRGMVLGCSFSESKEEIKLKKFMINERDKVRDTTHLDDNSSCRIVGCSVIDTLTFGDPEGRKYLNGYKKVQNLNRGEKAQKLQVAWVSRFAIESLYTGLGIGRLLAEFSKEIAGQYRLPKAKCLEVIRTVSKDRYSELIDSDSPIDFLTCAGFKIAKTKVKYAPPKWEVDPVSGQLMPSNIIHGKSMPNRKIYYYADEI